MKFKKLSIVLFLCVLFIFTGCYNVDNGNLSFEDVVENTVSGTVTIIAGEKPKSMGSGFCIKQGIILTNSHVVSDNSTVSVIASDETELSGEVIYSNSDKDIAVIVCDEITTVLPTKTLDQVQVGMKVFAVGTPLTKELHHTVTSGIISGKSREIKMQSGQQLKMITRLIQHDASINPGNSGGALITEKGEVVGMNTLKVVMGEGLGFAIPIDECIDVINELVLSKVII